MKRLNRKEEAVSPVIATILMVAITVVLAATLYMMVGDIGGEGVASLAASISHREDTTMEITSMSTPGSADIDDIEISVFVEDEEYSGTIDAEGWSIWDEDENEASSGSRFNVSDMEDAEAEWENFVDDGDLLIDEVVLRIDGYDGTASYDDF